MNTNIAKTYTQAALFLKKILLRTGDDAASCKKHLKKVSIVHCIIRITKQQQKNDGPAAIIIHFDQRWKLVIN